MSKLNNIFVMNKYIIVLITLLTSHNIFADGLNTKLQFDKEYNNLEYSATIDYRYEDSDLNTRIYDFGIKKSLKNNWSTELHYRAFYKYSDEEWKLEKRPHFNIKKTFKLETLKISIRNRIEYRIKGLDKTFRDRLRVSIGSNKEFLKIKPFISNEFFYDFEDSRYNKNWFSIGFQVAKSKYGKPSIYYKYVTDINDDNSTESSYAIVIKMKYDL
jgi:hypothetical protein